MIRVFKLFSKFAMGLEKVGTQYFKISQKVTRGVLSAKVNVFIR